VSTQGAGGNWTNAEGTKYGCWAEIADPSGFRVFENSQDKLGNTRSFKVRYRFDKFPNVTWKIRYDGKDWDISEIQKLDEKKFYYRITATAKHDV
jgi:SPP1 family predicted phage head-tail adaptor